MQNVEKYKKGVHLGSGGQGSVYKAVRRIDGKEFAMKVVEAATKEEYARDAREVENMLQLKHRNVVPCVDYFGTTELLAPGVMQWELHIVMPLYTGGDLQKLLEREGPLSREKAVRLLREVAEALAYLHGKGWIHRDVKPQNIMVDDGNNSNSETGFVLADLGLSRAVVGASGSSSSSSMITSSGATANSVVGTPAFMAPDFVGPYTNKVDMWALGVTVCFVVLEDEKLRERFLKYLKMNRDLVMGELEGRLPKLVGESVGTLLLRLLCEDPLKRPTASEVLSVLTTPPAMTTTTTTTMTMMELLAFADFGGEERKRLLLVAVGSGVEEVRVAAEEAFAKDGLERVHRVEVFNSNFDLFVDADSRTVFHDKERVKVFPEHTNNKNNMHHHHHDPNQHQHHPVLALKEASRLTSEEEAKRKGLVVEWEEGMEGFLGMMEKMQVVVKHNNNNIYHHHDPNQHQHHPVLASKVARRLTSEEEAKRKGLVVEWEEGMEGFLGMMGKMQVVVKHNELQLLDKLKERPPILVIDFTWASLVHVKERYVPLVTSFEHVVLKGVRGNIADDFLAQDKNKTTCRLRSLRFSLDSPVGVWGRFLRRFTGPGSVTSIGGSFLAGCTSLQAVDFGLLSNVTSIGEWFLQGCTSLTVIDLRPLSSITVIGNWFISGCTSLQKIKANDYLLLPESLEKLRQ